MFFTILEKLVGTLANTLLDTLKCLAEFAANANGGGVLLGGICCCHTLPPDPEQMEPEMG
jgi:hypothetical protein